MDWSESWSILIPLLVYWFHKAQPRYMRPVMFYLIAALILNLAADTIAYFALALHPDPSAWWYSNTRIYNLHNLIRFAFFSAFFYRLGVAFQKWVSWSAVIFVAGAIGIEIFVGESVFSRTSINSMLHTLEALLLLVLCLFYYLSSVSADDVRPFRRKSFWQVTAIAVYCVANFFVFLFYSPLLKANPTDTYRLWTLHNVAFVLSCIFTAIALYVPARDTDTA